MGTESLIISVSEKGSLVVKRNIAGIGATAKKSNTGVKLLKASLATLGVASAGLAIASGTRLLAEFGQEMATVKAITEATDSEFNALRETAKDLGRTTRFTATQAAEGMVFLSRAGFDANQTLETIDDTLKLAQAGALDLGTASRLTAQTIKGFRLETDQAARVADVLAKAANTANTDVIQLGDAIKFAAPAASGLGISLEETVAAVQLLSDAGLQGTLAGTGLRRALIELEAPGRAQAKILKELGLSTEDVKVSTNGLAVVMKRLRDAGLETGQAYQLFGQRAGAVGEILPDVINALVANTDALDAAGGTSDRIAKTMDETLNGALLRAKSAFQGLIIEIGDLGAESGLTQFLNNAAALLNKLTDNLKTVDRVFKIVAVAIGVLFARNAIAAAITGVKALIPQIVKLYATLNLNPTILLITALAAAVTAIFVFRDEIDILGNDFVTLGSIFTAAGQVIRGEVAKLRDETTDDLEEVGDQAKFSLDETALFALALVRAVFQVLDKISGAVIGTIAGIVDVVKLVKNRLKSGQEFSFEDIGDTFAEQFKLGFNANILTGFFDQTLDQATQNELDKLAKKTEEVKNKKPTKTPAEESADIVKKGTGGEDEDLKKLNEFINALEVENRVLAEQAKGNKELAERIALVVQFKGKASDEQLNNIQRLQKENEQFQRQVELLDEIKGPQDEYNKSVAALNALRDQGAISAEEYKKKLRELDAELKRQTKELDALSVVVAGVWDGARNALKQLTEEGKFEFRQFAAVVLDSIADILAGVLKLQAQQFIASALDIQIPGLGGASGADFIVGGSGGIDSQTIALNATPGERVRVETPGQVANAGGNAGGQVPTTIINLIDPADIPAIMAQAEGQKVTINNIRLNRTSAAQALS